MRGAGLEERGAGSRAQGAEGSGGRLRLGDALGSRSPRIRGIFRVLNRSGRRGTAGRLWDPAALALPHREWRQGNREQDGEKLGGKGLERLDDQAPRLHVPCPHFSILLDPHLLNAKVCTFCAHSGG